jgi:hypothetical protein
MERRLTKWEMRPGDLKRYPHFDALISIPEAMALATDPERVAKHTFYPFMLFSNRWTKFAPKGAAGKIKERPIRYAARSDAYILSYYRHQISQLYEVALAKAEISECVLAYRRLRTETGAGKCNIHFANDAFNTISLAGDCAVVALDISSFFEHLDHDRLRAQWSNIIKQKKLPPDHERVFRAVTRYSVVEKLSVYERLDLFGEKRKGSKGEAINGYLVPFKSMPKQLCTGKQFREKIAGGDGRKSLIQVNFKPFGIPQGSPISDLLANMYLFEFDIVMNDITRKLGGAYMRYSDDILLIIPGQAAAGISLMNEARKQIEKFGKKLRIKEEKCSVFEFKKTGMRQTCELVHGLQGRNGIEYLGFRFDGKNIFLRDSTLANLNRKIARVAKAHVFSLIKRYPGKDRAFLKSKIKVEAVVQRFGRVVDFGEHSDDYRTWTFWTYARRASVIFGSRGAPILRQLRHLREAVAFRLNAELEKFAR